MAMRLTNSSAGLLAVCDEAREYMTLVATTGYSRRLSDPVSWKIRRDGITSVVLDRDTPLLIPDLSEFPVTSPILEREGVKTLIVAPLTVNDKLVGMLQVSDINHGRYSHAELSLFSLLNVYAGRILNKARAIQELQLAGFKDQLTGLYNSDYMMDQLRLEICRAERHDGRMALLVVNIDGFRQFLKAAGALKVNRYLKTIGAYLRHNLREIDVAAHMDDGEFCILTPGLEGAGAKILSERLVSELSELPVLNGKVSFKAGIAVYPEDGLLKGELIKKVGARGRSRRENAARRYFNATRPERRQATL